MSADKMFCCSKKALDFLVIMVLLTRFCINAFTISNTRTIQNFYSHTKWGHQSSSRMFSFVADSSDYQSPDSDTNAEDEKSSEYSGPSSDGADEDEDSPTIEESPVPMSKNSGNRFLAFVFDKSFVPKGEDVDVMELHEKRIGLTEEHVMFCRKANLYNETFNTDSMTDILWSYQL